VIQDRGTAFQLHTLDENGIVQQPVLGVISYGGKDIREWAEKLYKQLAEDSIIQKTISYQTMLMN
jgi:protein involved in polysaccharide export with SLBB domain